MRMIETYGRSRFQEHLTSNLIRSRQILWQVLRHTLGLTSRAATISRGPSGRSNYLERRSPPLRALALILASVVLAGCATTLPTIAELKPVAADRRFANPTLGDSGVSLTVLRDKSFAGSAVDYRLFIDGKLSAQLAWGEFVTLPIALGERVIEVSHPSALVGAIGDSATLRAESGGRYFYRINSDLGQIRLLRTIEESTKSTP
jgi:hypothetical protein